MRDHVGIVGTGIYVPSTFMTAEELAEKTGIPVDVIRHKFGINRKAVPGPNDHTCWMGVQAALDCLRRTGTDPEDIDLVMYIGEEHKEYPLWTAGIKLQYDIGASRAWAFDVQLRCCTTIAAMKLARDIILSDSSINTILLAGGYRNVDFIDYKNPRVSFMYDLAAGGAAVLLKRNYGRNIILESALITDGWFSEHVCVPGGGTKIPMSHEVLDRGLYRLDVLRPEEMREGLNQKSMPNFIRVVRESLRRSGYTQENIGYIALLHMKRSAHEAVLQELGLKPHQSIYLEDYGHMGQLDQILSTHLAVERGLIKDGDAVVWVGAGIGYVWGAITIRWGPVTAEKPDEMMVQNPGTDRRV